ncbi:hypothetical protein BH11BAC7_BH11BAC7_30200 [soil metagenome]
MKNKRTIMLVFFTVLFIGLVAGLFYAYSCSVNIGLNKLSDKEYLNAMQSINSAIQNPIFFLTFMGLLILFPITSYQLYQNQTNAFGLFIAAMGIYFVCVFGVTIFGNVPLNEQLANFSIQTETENEIALMRQTFEKPWNAFHSIRTVASIISFASVILFILRQKV